MMENNVPTYHDIIRSPEFIAWFGNWEKAYNEAGLDFKHPAWKGVSKAVDANGMPEVWYHGTTHEWTVYSRKLGNHENDMGVGFYATSDFYDAERNYLSEGQDLKTRIALFAEAESDIKGTTMNVAKKIAEKKFKGSTERILEVFLKIKNPLIIDTERNFDATHFDFSYDYNEETEKYGDSKDLIKFKEAFDEVCDDYDFSYDTKNRIWSEFMENIEFDYISAYYIIQKLKSIDLLFDYTSNNGYGNSAYEFISQIFQEYGFDGVIYVDASKHFKGMGMDAGTRHAVAFKPKQIKLADGTNTTFDSKKSDIRFDDGGVVENDFVLSFDSESDMLKKFYEIRSKIYFDDENITVGNNDTSPYRTNSGLKPKFTRNELHEFIKNNSVVVRVLMTSEVGYENNKYTLSVIHAKSSNRGAALCNILYKDHHEVWDKLDVLEKEISEINCADISKKIVSMWDSELVKHFIEEEQVFFPNIKNEKNEQVINELLKEHDEIILLVNKIKMYNRMDDISKFCLLMKNHIKKEESLMSEISADPYKK